LPNKDDVSTVDRHDRHRSGVPDGDAFEFVSAEVTESIYLDGQKSDPGNDTTSDQSRRKGVHVRIARPKPA
jgi:hypothetical protein